MIDCSKIPYQDKGCHAIVGFIIAVFIGTVAFMAGFDYPQTYGLVVAVMSGVFKEVRDYMDYGKFDFFDMFATFVGAFFGGAVVTFL